MDLRSDIFNNFSRGLIKTSITFNLSQPNKYRKMRDDLYSCGLCIGPFTLRSIQLVLYRSQIDPGLPHI